jgi:hypothetical protein
MYGVKNRACQAQRPPSGSRRPVVNYIDVMAEFGETLAVAESAKLAPNYVHATVTRRTRRAARTGPRRRRLSPPQLVGLIKVGTGRTIPTHFNGAPFVLGAPLPRDALLPPGAECFNEVFERTDLSGELVDGAQRHSWP